MTTNDVHDLLEQACDQIPDTDLADAAWAVAYGRQVRRRRVLVALAAACSVATAGAVVASDFWAPTTQGHALTNSPSVTSPAGPTSPSTPATGSPQDAAVLARVWSLPDPGDMTGLPWSTSGPVQGEVDLVRSARLFSTSGGFRAGEHIDAAFAMPTAKQAGIVTSLGNIYLLDELTLRDTSDSSGNAHFHLSPSAISPDGTMLAIAQPNGVVLIDATRGAEAKPWHTIPIANPTIESANFVDGGRTILAGSDGGLYVVDVASGTSIKRPSRFGADEIVLSGGANSGGPVEVRTWDATKRAYGPAVAVTDPRIGEVWGMGGSNLPGTGFVAGLVSPTQSTLDALWRARGLNSYQGIAAVPLGGGEAALLLDVSQPGTDDASIAQSRSKAGIRPVGTTSEGNLLILADGGYAKTTKGDFTLVRQDLVSWNIRTGELARVAALTGEWVGLILRPGV